MFARKVKVLMTRTVLKTMKSRLQSESESFNESEIFQQKKVKVLMGAETKFQ